MEFKIKDQLQKLPLATSADTGPLACWMDIQIIPMGFQTKLNMISIQNQRDGISIKISRQLLPLTTPINGRHRAFIGFQKGISTEPRESEQNIH